MGVNDKLPKKRTTLAKYMRLNDDLVVHQDKVFMLEKGTILILEDELAKLFKVSKRMVQNYKEKGLEHHKSSVKGAIVYDLVYAMKWYYAVTEKTIETEQKAPPIRDSGQEINMKMLMLDHDIKTQKLSTDKLKHKELSKTLVKAEDLDRSMAEQAVLHKTYYIDDLELLPVALDGMNKDHISKFLSEHYKVRIENAQSFVQKTFKLPNHLYTKVMEFINEP